MENMKHGKLKIMIQKIGRLNITKVWEQAQVKNLKNIFKIRKYLNFNILNKVIM